jgi:acyl carrier protein
MSDSEQEVMDGVLALLEELKGDWDYEGEIVPGTRCVRDLGMESLEIVVLSTMIQAQYGKLPFPAFLDEIGQRPEGERDLTIAELAAFVSRYRSTTPQEV